MYGPPWEYAYHVSRGEKRSVSMTYSVPNGSSLRDTPSIHSTYSVIYPLPCKSVVYFNLPSPGANVGSVSTSVDLCRFLLTTFETGPTAPDGLQQLTISHLCLQHSFVTNQSLAQGQPLL
jgi:hypothetical protein